MQPPIRTPGIEKAGIEKMGAWPCTLSLDLETLGQARGAEPGYALSTVRGRTRSLNPPFEDPVTMAVNAARPMLTAEDLRDIELLIVGTESSPDQGKPISTFVHRHLGIQASCRNFECKHACYGGTSALMMAAHWVASGAAPGKKALVLCTDQSRINLGVQWEYVMGAGAVAMLVSDRPDVLEIDLHRSGYWTDEVGDTFRPTSRDEAGNTDSSLYCYLDALAGAWDHFHGKSPETDYDRDFAAHVYHMPFAGMAWRAHRTVLGMSGRRDGDVEASFARKVEPGTRWASLLGGTYTASTFFALMSLIEHAEGLSSGDRLSVFSYGSGSCAELWAARLGSRAREAIAAARLGALLAEREALSVAEYEAVEHQRASGVDQRDWKPSTDGLHSLYERRYAGQRRLVLRGVSDFFRDYGWS